MGIALSVVLMYDRVGSSIALCFEEVASPSMAGMHALVYAAQSSDSFELRVVNFLRHACPLAFPCAWQQGIFLFTSFVGSLILCLTSTIVTLFGDGTPHLEFGGDTGSVDVLLMLRAGNTSLRGGGGSPRLLVILTSIGSSPVSGNLKALSLFLGFVRSVPDTLPILRALRC
jgi:hypothetical protein